MQKFHARPTTVEAVKVGINETEVAEFVGTAGEVEKEPQALAGWFVNTMDSRKKAAIGDYIVKDSEGSFHVFTQKDFAETFACGEHPHAHVLLDHAAKEITTLRHSNEVKSARLEMFDRLSPYLPGQGIRNATGGAESLMGALKAVFQTDIVEAIGKELKDYRKK